MKDRTVDRAGNVGIGFGIMLLYLVLYFILGVLLGTYRLSDQGNSVPGQVALCAFSMFSVFLLLILLSKIGVFTFDFKFLTKRNLVMIFLSLFLGIAAYFIAIYFVQKQGIKMEETSVASAVVMLKVPTSFFIFAICTPIMEEVAFRGGIMGLIFQNHKILGVIVSSLIFAACHFPTNIYIWIYQIFSSFLLGLSYAKTDQLGVPIAIHILNNASSYIL